MAGLIPIQNFQPDTTDYEAMKRTKVETTDDIPKELDIFMRRENSFLPNGKKFEDLTPEELEVLKLRYRFTPLKPGMYQTLTGFGNAV